MLGEYGMIVYLCNGTNYGRIREHSRRGIFKQELHKDKCTILDISQVKRDELSQGLNFKVLLLSKDASEERHLIVLGT